MRALLFDFDGLILDTETPEIVTWTRLFEAHGVTFPTGYWIDALGRGADQIRETPTDILERELGTPIDHDAVRADYQRGRMEMILSQDPLPGVVALLEEAFSAGLPLGLVSSSKHVWVDGHLERLGLMDKFQIVVCAGDAPRAKPFPDLYLKALDLLDVPASGTVALEDSPNGARAAVAAGIFVAIIPNPSTQQLDVSHADVKLDSLEGVTVRDLDALLALPRR